MLILWPSIKVLVTIMLWWKTLTYALLQDCRITYSNQKFRFLKSNHWLLLQGIYKRPCCLWSTLQQSTWMYLIMFPKGITWSNLTQKVKLQKAVHLLHLCDILIRDPISASPNHFTTSAVPELMGIRFHRTSLKISILFHHTEILHLLTLGFNSYWSSLLQASNRAA